MAHFLMCSLSISCCEAVLNRLQQACFHLLGGCLQDGMMPRYSLCLPRLFLLGSLRASDDRQHREQGTLHREVRRRVWASARARACSQRSSLGATSETDRFFVESQVFFVESQVNLKDPVPPLGSGTDTRITRYRTVTHGVSFVQSPSLRVDFQDALLTSSTSRICHLGLTCPQESNQSTVHHRQSALHLMLHLQTCISNRV